MYYKIQKSLGRVSALLTDVIPQDGVCIEFKNFSQYEASIVIYQYGKPNDLHINGYTFPCVYNHIKKSQGSDIYGGGHAHVIDFEFIDPNGVIQQITSKTIYGGKESLAVEYFYSLLYNISCCENIGQYELLYECIIDNKLFSLNKTRNAAIKVLDFIESFALHLKDIKDKEFLEGLKQKMDIKFNEAKAIIADSDSPL